VDRKMLWKAIEERAIKRELIERVKEIYEQIKNAVRVQHYNRNITNWFWMKKGIRQGRPVTLCPNSRCGRGDEKRANR